MRREMNITSPLRILAETVKGVELISRRNPPEVMAEVKKIVLLMFRNFEFNQIEQVFDDILKLFSGKYPGYRRCNTFYHDLNHTMDCLLVTAEIIHGAFVHGIRFGKRDVNLGLISALMHDTGYIQAEGDAEGSGAKYTLCHVARSIEFMAKYVHDHQFPLEYIPICSNLLRCTGLEVKIAEITFQTREHEILGKILGTADLIGQMANENYPEKLHFLYQEFQEGGVPGFKNEYDFLNKTPGFWEMVKERFALELGRVDLYLGDHFRVRWGIDQDLYRKAIDRNMERVKLILEKYRVNYARHLGCKDQRGLTLGSPI